MSAPDAHQPRYQQPAQPYPSYPVQAYAPPKTTLGETNTFAFLAIVFAFLVPLAAIIFGHMGLSQIKRNGDGGRGIAITGLVIGYVYFVFAFFIMFLYLGMIAVLISEIPNSPSGYAS